MYFFQGLFAVFRIIVCFYLLFGVLAPLFLPKVKSINGIDRLMHSWVGLGGLILVVVLILTALNLYDFISLLVSLLVIPLAVYVFKERRKGMSYSEVFLAIETLIIAQHVRIIESTISLWDRFRDRAKLPHYSLKETTPQLVAFLIAFFAAGVRIIPALQNSAPFSRTWYFELGSVKALSLQQYFDLIPEPKGMHVLVHVFSTLTQVSPELILHILGALTSFFLALIIFWMINVITNSENPLAALVGMSIYAFVPMYVSPIILDLEVEANSISLALCFAIPTVVFFLRLMREGDMIMWFYVCMGIFATALTNVFIFLMVLIPILFLGLLTLPIKSLVKRLGWSLLYIVSSSMVALFPYILVCTINGIPLQDFFQRELFDTLIFSYFPNLVIFIDELSMYYLLGGVILLIINIILIRLKVIGQKKELVFLILFILVSYIYTPYFPFSYVLIDPDQLNLFYALLIAVFFGLIFLNLTRLIKAFAKKNDKVYWAVNISSSIGFVLLLIFLQQGVLISRALPSTLPNGFFDAYYRIVNERVPYSYATVSPELDRGLAQNRHFFMNYEFFLDNYGVIDSLYQQYLTVPRAQREQRDVPPASIFLFLEKPPYTGIQQGILYNPQNTMSDMQQWIEVFENLEGRNIQVYYESDDAIVYEIINREKESRVTAVLRNVFPEEEPLKPSEEEGESESVN